MDLNISKDEIIKLAEKQIKQNINNKIVNYLNSNQGETFIKKTIGDAIFHNIDKMLEKEDFHIEKILHDKVIVDSLGGNLAKILLDSYYAQENCYGEDDSYNWDY